MRYEVIIHNNDVTCFHVDVKGTQKVVVIGRHNFEDEVLIKRWLACQKMNEMSGKFKDENKWSNYQKLFSFVVGSCVYIRSFGIHKNMSVESAIEKLQKVIREKETQKSEHRRKHVEEA